MTDMMGSQEQGKLTSLLEDFVSEQGKGPWESEAFVGKARAALQGICKALSTEVVQMQQNVIEYYEQCCVFDLKTINGKLQVQAKASQNVSQAPQLQGG